MTTVELLQGDDWSDDENSQPPDLQHALLEIKRLKEHLTAAQRDLTDYRTLVNKNITNILGDTTLEEIRKEELPSTLPPRDDDTHYFESYSDSGALHSQSKMNC